MIDIVLQYEPSTGELFDPTTNTTLSLWYSGLIHLQTTEYQPKEVEKEVTVRDISDKVVQLSAAGFTAEEIVLMKKEGLL